MMRFRSLEHRIVALFLILILAVQLASFFAIRGGIDANARASIQNELAISERVFNRLLEQNAQKLTQGARLLAADYGFRQALASNERETIASALVNHGARIGATLTMLIGPERQVKVSTAAHTPQTLADSSVALVDEAEDAGSARRIVLFDQHPYQMVLVPVKAPISIAWVAMAFPIDQKLVADMHDLSGLQVSVLAGKGDGNWRSTVSTLAPADAAALATQMHDLPLVAAGAAGTLRMASGEFIARALPLAKDASHVALVVLQRSVAEAIAPYRRLQLLLLILNGVGIVVAVVASFFAARRIATPLKGLAQVAERFGRGDYDPQVVIQGDDEIAALSRAFESMRAGIVQREAEIGRLAYWDTLTDLPNRARFTVLLDEAIAAALADCQPVHVLMMDLDRFKNVNDVLGHTFGDALLRGVAERLKVLVAPARGQVLARLGGDEFAILLPGTPLSGAHALATRILASLETPISLEDQTVDLGAGIGIAGAPDHGTTAEILLSRAEVAMYAAKKTGNECLAYDPLLDKGSQQSLSMLSDLRRALERNEFRLYVQPKVEMQSGEVIGLEALVRWVHPERGMIYPDSFIPFAEKTGFIRLLTQWVLDQAAALCHTLAEQGIDLKISVNLSTRDLLDQNLPQKLAAIFARHQVEPRSFCLEITESAIMDDPVRAQLTLEGLHAMKIDLSIDDFGTGYSSLAYLKRLPVDELKIDKSFVMNMEGNADDAKIVSSTISLGHNMGLRVVAEGIESEIVWNLLVGMGCNQGQGYFMSRPMPAEQLPVWLGRWRPPAAHAQVEQAAQSAQAGLSSCAYAANEPTASIDSVDMAGSIAPLAPVEGIQPIAADASTRAGDPRALRSRILA